jgi:hypothetical protein
MEAHGTIMDDHTILTHNHWKYDWTSKDSEWKLVTIRIYDSSGYLLFELEPGDSVAVAKFQFDDGNWSNTMRLEFNAPVFAGRPPASFIAPGSMDPNTLIGQDVAVISWVADPTVPSGRRTTVRWTSIVDTAYVNNTKKVSVPCREDDRYSGLRLDQSGPKGSSGGGAYVYVDGKWQHVGVVASQYGPAVGYISINYLVRE